MVHSFSVSINFDGNRWIYLQFSLFPRLGCVNTYHFVYTHFVWSPMQQTIAFLSLSITSYYVKVVLTYIVILLVMIQSNSAFDIIPPFSNPMWFKIFHDYLVEYETGVSWVDSDWFGGDRIWEPVLYIIPIRIVM